MIFFFANRTVDRLVEFGFLFLRVVKTASFIGCQPPGKFQSFLPWHRGAGCCSERADKGLLLLNPSAPAD